jgi:hypothetical protein
MKMRMGLILSALEDFKAARVAAEHGGLRPGGHTGTLNLAERSVVPSRDRGDICYSPDRRVKVSFTVPVYATIS